MFRVISIKYGLLWTGDKFTTYAEAEYIAICAAINSGRIVYLHCGEENN